MCNCIAAQIRYTVCIIFPHSIKGCFHTHSQMLNNDPRTAPATLYNNTVNAEAPTIPTSYVTQPSWKNALQLFARVAGAGDERDEMNGRDR